MAASYILPIRRDRFEECDELTAYLEWLSPYVEVIVVDGSPPAVFERHHRLWSKLSFHIPPNDVLRSQNGKVWGVNTGLEHASHARVIIADDDVRYDGCALARAVALLGEAEIVRPQNYFAPLPWHALWDTGRSLLNRAAGGDWPGTLGLRADVVRAYDGDVLFENLELCRTVEAGGGRQLVALDLYVRRLPPSVKQFWSQRIRQAYDEFARPRVLLAQLLLGPCLAWLLVTQRLPLACGLALTPIGVAEYGRRRAGGTRYFPASASLMAPVWLAERAVTSWLAVYQRLRHGGVRYRGQVLRTAANSVVGLRCRTSPDVSRRSSAGTSKGSGQTRSTP